MFVNYLTMLLQPSIFISFNLNFKKYITLQTVTKKENQHSFFAKYKYTLRSKSLFESFPNFVGYTYLLQLIHSYFRSLSTSKMITLIVKITSL